MCSWNLSQTAAADALFRPSQMTRKVLIYLLAEVQMDTDFCVDALLEVTQVWDSFEKSSKGKLASVWLQTGAKSCIF